MGSVTERLALAIFLASKGNGRNNVLINQLIHERPTTENTIKAQGEKARQFVRDNDWGTVVDAFENVLLECVKSNGREVRGYIHSVILFVFSPMTEESPCSHS